jgi:hypothetical protein
MAMTLVSTVTVGSGGAASIEFTGIAGTGKDLLILLSNRLDAGQFTGNVQFNSDTGSNYSQRRLFTNGNGVFSDSGSTTRIQFIGMGKNDATANTFASDAIYVSNYTSSVAKSVSIDGVSENNSADAFAYALGIAAGRWTGTSAITSVTLSADGSNFVQHTTASLYIIS